MLTHVGVRQLVEFLLKTGDLNATLGSDNSLQAGSRIHRKIQKQRSQSYQAEVPLSETIDYLGDNYVISGRADGIDVVNEQPLIEEIKTSDRSFDELSEGTLVLYWAQVKVYAYMYLKDHPGDQVTLKLTYVQTPVETITETKQQFSKEVIDAFFADLLAQYEQWLKLRKELNEQRIHSAQSLSFPFGQYRRGQRELAVSVYKSIFLETPLLAEAPTGTGKTISTLFPTIKAMGEELISRSFYLTAKQSTRRVAEQAIQLMSQTGLTIKSITLTAKDQMIFESEQDLSPEENPYMLGYYDRIKPAILDIITNESQFDKVVIQQYAQKHMVDPFEFSLDISLFCDVIICDYNYLFDPQVHLQRFFTAPDKNNVFLIDEAHNLVKRSRQMYSAALSSTPINDLMAELKQQPADNDALIKQFSALKRAFSRYGKIAKESVDQEVYQAAVVTNFNKAVGKLADAISDWLPKQENGPNLDHLLDYFFACRRYLLISQYYEEDRFMTRVSYSEWGYEFKQICLDPSYNLANSIALGRSAIFFSATLSPLSYYQRLFGLDDEDSGVQALPSPFDSKHQQIVITNNIQTTYRKRPDSITTICQTIMTMVTAKPGNYLIFFPSGKYLDQVYEAFSAAHPEINTVLQTDHMSEEERQTFLNQFNDQVHPKVGFALLGGIFSEGIDLKGQQLIGVGIVSVGLPQINSETNLLKDYFDDQVGDGFSFAYQLPGFNNVAQAVGRLIRTESDLGVIVLMDQRFSQTRYRNIYPTHWQNVQHSHDTNSLQIILTNFWKNQA